MSFVHGIRGGRRAVIMLAALALALAVSIPVTVSAGGRGAIVVRGVQQEYGSCGGGTGYLMTGALQGCWWVDTFDVKPMPVQGTMLAYGTEHFTGWLGDRYGTFYTRYEYTARFDGATELHGRCHHPIIGGDGDFEGARGELSFTDLVDEQPFSYPYWGNIQLARGVGAAIHIQVSSVQAAPAGVATAPC